VQMVCIVKKMVMPTTEVMNRFLRPKRSTMEDAASAQMRFQICNTPLMRS
jgi:hypothetical protein